MTIQSPFSIAEIERETGISRDILRVWERRYTWSHSVTGDERESTAVNS